MVGFLWSLSWRDSSTLDLAKGKVGGGSRLVVSCKEVVYFHQRFLAFFLPSSPPSLPAFFLLVVSRGPIYPLPSRLPQSICRSIFDPLMIRLVARFPTHRRRAPISYVFAPLLRGVQAREGSSDVRETGPVLGQQIFSHGSLPWQRGWWKAV